MKPLFTYLIKFFLLAVSVYLASYFVFVSWDVLEWPVWYRTVLAIAFVLGVTGYIASDDDEDEGYSRKFWKDHLPVITAYANGEDIKYQPNGNPEWSYIIGEQHLFKKDMEYRIVKPATDDTKKNSMQQDNSDTTGELQ